jgi:putative DNA primase/helicase
MNFKEEFARVQAASTEANAKQARKREATAERNRRAGERVDPATAQQGTNAVEIARLAKLSPLQYEQERKQAAEKLGVRTSILDRIVRDEWAKLGLDGGNGLQGRAVSFPPPQPWPEPVDGVALLDATAAAIGSHVIMPERSRNVAALWVLHTYLLDCFMITPRLAILSPVKRCGKTTLLDVLAHLVLRPLSTANISAAAMFRVVEAHRPTFMVDEGDYLHGNNELQNVIKSGHRRGEYVLRTVGDDYETRAFNVFAPIAIALIGALPDQLADRSVTLNLKRRLASEKIRPFRFDRTGHLDVLARKAARWAQDHAEAVGAADPAMPAEVFNREADNWAPLLAIADVAGGDWPERARTAATTARGEAEDESRLEMLLGDIRATFARRDRLPSADLIETLVKIDGRPWAEYGKTGKPMTQNRLATLLKPLAIAPEQIRFAADDSRKGYHRHQFNEAFERYLPPDQGFEPKQQNKCDEMSNSSGFQTETTDPNVSVGKCEKSNNYGLCFGVSVKKGEERVCAHCGAPEAPGNPIQDCAVDGEMLVLCAACQAAALPPPPSPLPWPRAAPPTGASCLLCRKGGEVFMVDLGDGRPAPLHRGCAAILEADIADEEVAAWWNSVRL